MGPEIISTESAGDIFFNWYRQILQNSPNSTIAVFVLMK